MSVYKNEDFLSNYTVKPPMNPFLKPKGKYKARITEAQRKTSDRGGYVSIVWRIEEGEFDGDLIYENFYIEAYNPILKHIADQDFSSFLRQVANMDTNEKFEDYKVCGKFCEIEIDHVKSKKSEALFTKVVNRKLIDKVEEMPHNNDDGMPF